MEQYKRNASFETMTVVIRARVSTHLHSTATMGVIDNEENGFLITYYAAYYIHVMYM